MSDQGEMEVTQKEELQSGEGTREGAYFRPEVDIYESDEAITVLADVPGCAPDDFEINLEDSRLTILAETGGLEERWKPAYREYREGHFLREFRLGKKIDQSNISAHLTNGVLELHLPKREEAKTKKIEIQTG